MPQEIELHVQENGGAVELTAEQALIIEAVSPTVDLQRVEGGVEITVHDVRGEQTAEVMDGAAGAEGPQGPEGEPGPAGADGVSPAVTVTDITGGHRVSITDAEGTQTFDVMDGETGPQGPQGIPGHDYILTTEDKAEIVAAVLAVYPAAEGVSF